MTKHLRRSAGLGARAPVTPLDPWRPVRRGFLLLGLVVVAGTIGYLLLGLSLLDALYQTVTTVSTVGFPARWASPPGRGRSSPWR